MKMNVRLQDDTDWSDVGLDMFHCTFISIIYWHTSKQYKEPTGNTKFEYFSKKKCSAVHRKHDSSSLFYRQH